MPVPRAPQVSLAEVRQLLEGAPDNRLGLQFHPILQKGLYNPRKS
jgi:hypothetical protein